MTTSVARTPRYDSWDVMHHYSPDSEWWTTTNVGEAAPGVQTPLSFTTWARATPPGVTAAGIAIGVFTAADHYDGDVMVQFYGRAYMSANFLKLIGDRMDGRHGLGGRVRPSRRGPILL
jgi:hypothetical protein